MTRAEAERRVKIARALYEYEAGGDKYAVLPWAQADQGPWLRDADIAIAALDALPDTGEADGWRPISEAPRDGTPILLVQQTKSGPAYLVARNPHISWDAAWWEAWMPLPAPPNTGEG